MDEYPTISADGETWLICPLARVGCGFRVLNDVRLGEIPRDAIDVHVQVSHELPTRLSGIGQLLAPPPDPHSAGDKLWTRKKGA